jgi:hypothetical protein
MDVRPIIYRQWFVWTMIVAALALAAGQLAIYLAFKPSFAYLAAGSALSVVMLAILGCIVACAHRPLRRRWADLRYRWLTRSVEREVKTRRSRA